MKKYRMVFRLSVLTLCCSLFMFSSCENMLTVDSGRFVTVDDNGLSYGKDSVSSVLGLLTGMQKIGERYILLGEMRADLLDVTEFTPAAIRQLSNYTADSTNEYANPRDYYELINNCNYFISRTSGTNNPLKNENALAHTIRAWTYMQIASIWGKAYYITKPLLSVEDTKKEYPVLDMNQLSDALIADLEPYALVKYPDYGKIYNYNSTDLFLPMNLILGDLYLWRGKSTDDYEKAATYYAEYIDSNVPDKGINIQPSIRWDLENFQLQNFETAYPLNLWSVYTVASHTTTPGNVQISSGEYLTLIQMADGAYQGIVSKIPENFKYYGASKVINNLWDDQNFTLVKYVTGSSIPVFYTAFGDLRKQGNIVSNLSLTTNLSETENVPVLYKLYYADHILLYRMGLVFLRYAEAINRAGNPNAAFAVLKYGLNPTDFVDVKKLPETERVKPYIAIFNDDKYENMIGIHARGCGDAAFEASYKVGGANENLLTKVDSILWVEESICTELALETSFEGNRFGDLMRMAQRRNDPAFLAKRIAAKHPTDYDRIFNLLSPNTNNWFLPEPK